MYLYHATDTNNVESIVKYGLLIQPPKHAYSSGYYVEGKIFLAFDANVAYQYAKNSDHAPNNITVFKINYDSLKSDAFEYDWNNFCEYYSDINSCVYCRDIPTSCLSICNPSTEPSQTLKSFKGEDVYDIVMRTFDEEVESNIENYTE